MVLPGLSLACHTGPSAMAMSTGTWPKGQDRKHKQLKLVFRLLASPCQSPWETQGKTADPLHRKESVVMAGGSGKGAT